MDKEKKKSVNKKPQLSINKHNISLRNEVNPDVKERRAQRTGGERATRAEEPRKEEQWNMKTVKKQKEEPPRSS